MALISFDAGVPSTATSYGKWAAGLVAFENRRFWDAAEYFEECLEDAGISIERQAVVLHNSGESWLRNYLAGYESDRDDLDSAIDAFESAVKLVPSNAVTLNSLGIVLREKKGRLDKGIEYLTRALELEPGNPAILNNRGNLYAERGDTTKAFQDYGEAIALKPDYAAAFHNRGLIYCRQSEFDNAIFEFDAAIRLGLDLAEPYQEKALILEQLGEDKKALVEWRKAFDVGRDSTRAVHSMAAKKLNDHGLLTWRETFQSLGLVTLFKRLPLPLRVVFGVRMIGVGLLVYTSLLVAGFLRNYQGLSLITWALSFTVLVLVLFVVWRWAGRALPPASVVDKKYLGDHPEQSQETTPPGETEGASPLYSGRVASEGFWERVPLFETVNIRAFALQGAIAILGALVLVDVGAAIFQWLREVVLASPLSSIGIATICFVVALLVGAIRQVHRFLLSRARPIPIIDERGRPKLAYIGDVPPMIWQYSPWFRAGTWAFVAATSLFSAVIGSLIVEQHVAKSLIPTLVAVLMFRWLVSSIPKTLLQRSQAAEPVETDLVPDISGEESSLHPDEIADAEYDEFMKTYYLSEPNPERTAKAIRYLISSRILKMASDNPGEGKLGCFFLARIAVRNASVLRLCEEALDSAYHEGRILLLDVLSSVGDATTKGFLKKRVIQQSYRHERAEMERALSSDLPSGLLNPLRNAISSGSQLDLLWVEFFVSGNEIAVRRIIQVLEWPDRIREELGRWLLAERTGLRRILQRRPDLIIQKIEDALGVTVDLSRREIRTVEDLDCLCSLEGVSRSPERLKLATSILPFRISHEQAVEIGIKLAAKWSLAANALGDSRIRKICEEEAGVREGRAKIALLEILVAVHRDLGEHERAAQFLQQYVQLNPEGMQHFVGL